MNEIWMLSKCVLGGEQKHNSTQKMCNKLVLRGVGKIRQYCRQQRDKTGKDIGCSQKGKIGFNLVKILLG